MKYTNEERLIYAKTEKELHPFNNIHPTAQIHHKAEIGNDGFGYARDIDERLVKMPHKGNVIIEKNVVIRAFVTVDRAMIGSTIISEGTKIDHHCHIAHGAKIGRHNTFADGCIIEGSCEVGDCNTFGTNVIIQTKVKVGSNCKFGSGAVITKDVPDGSTWVGNPARPLVKKTIKYPSLETDDLAI